MRIGTHLLLAALTSLAGIAPPASGGYTATGFTDSSGKAHAHSPLTLRPNPSPDSKTEIAI
jgi:hypothetical protein